MEKINYERVFEDVLQQCQETLKNFKVSNETMKYIQRVEQSLKNLIDEID